jgi:hypothetical protein
VIRQNGRIVAEHRRSFGRGETVYDPWHYMPVLARKPGALRNGAPFRDWVLPAALMRLRELSRVRECQQDAEIDRTVAMADAATEADYNVVKLRIWARQWRASKLAPKKYGDRSEVPQTIDVADRIMKRWKDNLTKLNELEPLPPRVIEGGKVNAAPSATGVEMPPRIEAQRVTVPSAGSARAQRLPDERGRWRGA